jgi:YgiT-type zinc finger domain-containing protein
VTRAANGEIRLGRKPKVVQRDGRVAVVTDVPVEECPSCGMTWLDGPVARRLDELFRGMLARIWWRSVLTVRRWRWREVLRSAAGE